MKVIYCSKFWPMFWSGAWGMTIGKYVFIRKDMLAYPEYARDSMIVHEKVHFEQQQKAFLPWWLAKYIFSRAFRREMEMEAYLVEFEYDYWLWRKRNIDVSLDPALWAGRVSGKTYLWMISKEEAEVIFRRKLADLVNSPRIEA